MWHDGSARAGWPLAALAAAVMTFAHYAQVAGKELTGQKLLDAIEGSKSKPLANLLVGLNIRHLGGAGAVALAEHCGHLDRIESATEEELAGVEGMGAIIASPSRGRSHWHGSSGAVRHVDGLRGPKRME